MKIGISLATLHRAGKLGEQNLLQSLIRPDGWFGAHAWAPGTFASPQARDCLGGARGRPTEEAGFLR